MMGVFVKLHPLYKNVQRKQNPFKIVLKNISKFDGQNFILRNFEVKLNVLN